MKNLVESSPIPLQKLLQRISVAFGDYLLLQSGKNELQLFLIIMSWNSQEDGRKGALVIEYPRNENLIVNDSREYMIPEPSILTEGTAYGYWRNRPSTLELSAIRTVYNLIRQ